MPETRPGGGGAGHVPLGSGRLRGSHAKTGRLHRTNEQSLETFFFSFLPKSNPLPSPDPHPTGRVVPGACSAGGASRYVRSLSLTCGSTRNRPSRPMRTIRTRPLSLFARTTSSSSASGVSIRISSRSPPPRARLLLVVARSGSRWTASESTVRNAFPTPVSFLFCCAAGLPLI